MNFSIDTSGIDIHFPRPNKNNNSDQFRVNFKHIKDGLDAIAVKVTDLDNNVALKTQTALLGESNDGRLFLNAVSCGHVKNEHVLSVAEYDLDYALGEYQIYRVTQDCTITLNKWPENMYGKVRLELRNTNIVNRHGIDVDDNGNIVNGVPAIKVTFTSTSGIIKSQAGLLPLIVPASNIIIIDFWTTDTGSTIFSSLIGTYS